MRSFPLLWRSRSWAVLSLLSIFAFSLPCAAQYPGGGSGGGGYPGGGSSGGSYPGGGSWQALPCDAGGVPLSSPAYDQDGFLPLTGTQTGTASTTYPYPMRDTARRYPNTAGYYLTSFSPNDETQFPYTPSSIAAVIYPGFSRAGVGVNGSGYCTCYAHNYIVNSSGVDVGYYAGDDGQGHTILGDIKGGVTASASSVVNNAATVNAYFKWFYLNGGQAVTPPIGDPGPPTPMYLMLHSRVHVDASVDYGGSTQTSGLTASAFATDGFGDTVSQGTPPGAPTDSSFQTMEMPFLLQPTLSSSGIATVALLGTTSTSVNNTLSFGAFGFAPYVNTYKTTNGPTAAAASAYVTARTEAVTPFLCHSTIDSANWDMARPLFFSGTNCTVTGSLTLPPQFTVLHGQLSVNSLVTQEYDDRATTPLSTDPRIAYSMGMSQSLVSLPTPFDATIYPEGYTLPLRLKVWSSQGGPFEANLSAPVHLPQLTPYVIWTPDYTAAPVNFQLPQALAPSGTAMGGSSTLRVRVAYPPYASGTLTELRLHLRADPDATRDIIFPAVPLRLATVQNQAQIPYAAWAALCQDPDPALTLSPPCAYAEVPWNPSAGVRNGVYDLTSAVTVTGSDGVTRTWTSPAFTVDREDLLITATTPANPTPLLWDPDKLNPATGAPDALPLSAAFHAAYKAAVTATVQVYSSDQTLVRTLTRAILTTDGTTDTGTPMLWDGNGEPVNGQPGPPQPRGVYLFQWTLTDSLGVTDCDKSASLSVSQTDSVLTGDYNAATDQSTTKDSCVLTDNLSPLTAVATANVCVYGADLSQIVAPTLLSPLMPNAPSQSSPVRAVATFLLVTQGEEVHLFSAQDNHASVDRGGRNLWALQHNKGVNRSCAVAFTQGGSFRASDKFMVDRSDFLSPIQAMQYRAMYLGKNSAGDLLNRFGYYSNEPGPSQLTVNVMRRALEHQTLGGVKLLRVIMFAGDGSADGQSIQMRLINPASSAIDLVASQAYHQSKPHIAGAGSYHMDCQDTTTDALELDTIAPKGATGFSSPTALSNLDLVLLVACHQGINAVATANTNGANGALGSQFVNLGAGCVVRVGADDSYTSCENVFLKGRPSFPQEGFMNMLQAQNMTIAAAKAMALNATTNFLNTQTVGGPYNNCQIAVTMEGPRQNIILKP